MDGTEAHPASLSTAPVDADTLAAKVAALEVIVSDLWDRQEIHERRAEQSRGTPEELPRSDRSD